MGRISRNNLLGYSGNGGEAQIFHTLKNNSILYSFSDKNALSLLSDFVTSDIFWEYKLINNRDNPS